MHGYARGGATKLTKDYFRLPYVLLRRVVKWRLKPVYRPYATTQIPAVYILDSDSSS
jgi:hypothetical protein